MMIKKILAALAVFFITGCGPLPIANQDSNGTTIVCFGDSLTQGYGAGEGHDYPSLLRQKVNMPVINAGVIGDTTKDGLERLARDALSKNPKIVIITLGGNDFLQHIPKEETLRNMEAMIDKIEKQGAMVVWATVKTGIFGDAYTKDFAQLAREKHICLIPDILKEVMANPQYRYDEFHPNDEGYKVMAERIYKSVKPLLK